MAQDMTMVEIIHCMVRVCDAIDAAQQQLGELDARAGDGDLGVSLSLGAKAVRNELQREHSDLGSLLSACAKALRRSAPSTAGTLFAAGLQVAGRAAQGWQSVRPHEAQALLRQMLEVIGSLGGARVGDKTMLDALLPALGALERAEVEGSDLPEALRLAAAAAASGVEATAAMVPQVGRGAWLGERAAGVPDGGATAVAVAFSAAALAAGEHR